MRLPSTRKHIMLFEKDALGRVIQYEVERIEDTNNSRPVKLEFSGGTCMMLPRKKYKDVKRFMESKHEYLVITIHWNGKLESHCYTEEQYKKLLKKISSP